MCTLGFKVFSIRSAHSAAVRDECVESFTTTGNIGKVQIPVTSTRIPATAVNLQADCSGVMFLDILNNAQTLLQAVALVLRIGQAYPCNSYILTVDGTYDQAMQAIQALKMRPIIAGYCMANSSAAFCVRYGVVNATDPHQHRTQFELGMISVRPVSSFRSSVIQLSLGFLVF